MAAREKADSPLSLPPSTDTAASDAATADLAAWRADAAAAAACLDEAAASPAAAAAVAARVAALDAALSTLAPRLPPHDAARALEMAAGLRARADAARAVADRAAFRLPTDGEARAAALPLPPPSATAAPAAAAAAAQAAVRISGHSDTALTLGEGDVPPGCALELATLTRCTVAVTVPLAALRLEGLTDTTVAMAHAVGGAVVVDGVSGGALALAAHQARIHRAVATDLYLAVGTPPIIEECERVRVAPLAPGPTGAVVGGGAWREVKDFGWPRSGPSPHWSVLPEEERRPPLA